MPLVTLRVFCSLIVTSIVFLINKLDVVRISYAFENICGPLCWKSKFDSHLSKRWLQAEPSHNGGRHRNHTMPDSSGMQNGTLKSNQTNDLNTSSLIFSPGAWRGFEPSHFPSLSFSNAPSANPSSPNATENITTNTFLNFNFTEPSFIAPNLFNNSNSSITINFTSNNGTFFSPKPNILNATNTTMLSMHLLNSTTSPINDTHTSDSLLHNKNTNTTIITDSEAMNNVSSQIQGWNGCEEPGGKGSLVKKGNTSTICISVSGGGDWSRGINYSRWFYKPVADEYSHFTVENSFNDLVLSENPYRDEVSVHISSQQALSFIRRYYDEAEDKIYPYLTAILDVTDGIVTGIAWDDACVHCKKTKKENNTRCEENTYDFAGNLTTLGTEKTKGCYFTKEECTEFKNKKSNICDLNIYFVWTGSDVNGRILSSSGSRWSAFSFSALSEISAKFL